MFLLRNLRSATGFIHFKVKENVGVSVVFLVMPRLLEAYRRMDASLSQADYDGCDAKFSSSGSRRLFSAIFVLA